MHTIKYTNKSHNKTAGKRNHNRTMFKNYFELNLRIQKENRVTSPNRFYCFNF